MASLKAKANLRGNSVVSERDGTEVKPGKGLETQENFVGFFIGQIRLVNV